jgi:putative hydrolase of the HAD superfamily
MCILDSFDGDPLHVVPDAPAALTRLHERGIDLGVISNWDHTLEAILKRKGLAHFFKVIVASTRFGHAKPERAIFEHALARIGATAGESWHVGDDPDADAIGAARAGLHALLLDPHGLYASLDKHGIVRARTLTQAAARILDGAQGAASGSGAPST